jgi:hypothetical protein
MIDCPALQRQSEHYPARFRGRVPKRIKMAKTVRPDCPGCKPGTVALIDSEYDAWTNSHGAVCAVCENGEYLGVKPDEFDVIEWHNAHADAPPIGGSVRRDVGTVKGDT